MFEDTTRLFILVLTADAISYYRKYFAHGNLKNGVGQSLFYVRISVPLNT